MQKVIDTSKLETLLQSKWTEFIDKTQFLRIVMEHVRDRDYKVHDTKNPPPKQMKLSITKFAPFQSSLPFAGVDTCNVTRNNLEFEVWAEFSIPKGNGVVIGTHIYRLELTGDITLEQIFGTHFLTENT